MFAQAIARRRPGVAGPARHHQDAALMPGEPFRKHGPPPAGAGPLLVKTFAHMDDLAHSDADLIGIVAIGLHARDLAAWRKDLLARLGREPTEEERRAFHAGRSAADYRTRAADMLALHAPGERAAPARRAFPQSGGTGRPDGRPPFGRLAFALAILVGFVVVLARVMEPLSAWLFTLAR
jgi:hypothetical protein